MTDNIKTTIMNHPFPKSTSMAERYKRLIESFNQDDSVAILINADPDSIASAMALKRLFWRRVRKTEIYRINTIKRLDNLALIRLLNIKHKHIRGLNSAEISGWAIVDSQPAHNELFGRYNYDVIIDHHPYDSTSRAPFVDIREEYGANSTIMTEYLKSAGIKPSPKLATALFYAIKTDTDNFVRSSAPSDINAFRYLYPFANINMIKKIEASEISRKNLDHFRIALENLRFVKDRALINMGKIQDPDILVIIADFFLKMAEATWSIVTGIYGNKLIIIFRNAGFRLDAGKVARKLFGQLGSAGGHSSAARAELSLNDMKKVLNETHGIEQFMMEKIKSM
ncbi:MAG: DHH family phosphoesterase [Deltaproteobacteria bacterium]|nr:DHH family phosphoesterase [Deltaproteobacteria bacterium]